MEYVIYTDGSTYINPGLGGWGVIGIKNNLIIYKKYGGSLFSTNNKMELMSIIYAITINENSKSIEVITDSKYIIVGIYISILNKIRKQDLNKQMVNFKYWKIIFFFIIKKKIKWKWTKSHLKNNYNNIVDIVSKNANTKQYSITK